MTTATLPAPAPVPALARRPSPATAVANSFTLAWRSVLKIKTNPEDLFGLWLQPIMYLVLFTYVFGGAIAGGANPRCAYTPAEPSERTAASMTRVFMRRF